MCSAVKKVTNMNKKKMEPPDGGWGWMIVIGTAATNIFNQSLLSLFGLLYGDQLARMGQGTQGAALVLSTMLLVLNFGGPLSGSFVNLTSPRTVALTGALLTASGCMLSGLSTSLWHLTLTYGVCLGLGLGFIQNASFVALNSYFKKRKGRAVGFSAAGTGVGQMLMPHVVRYLLEAYTFGGTTLIMGGLCLQGVIGALLLQPVAWHMKTKPHETETRHLLEKNPPLNGIQVRHRSEVNPPDLGNFRTIQRRSTDPSVRVDIRFIQRTEGSHKDINFSNITDNVINYSTYSLNRQGGNSKSEKKNGFTELKLKTKKEEPRSMKSKIMKLLDVGLLSDLSFLNIIIGSALVVTSLQNFSLIFPFFLQDSVSLSKEDTAMCMSFVAGADIIGRLTLPSIAERFKISARLSSVISSILIIIIRQFIAHQTDYTLLLTGSLMYGFSRSMIVVNQNIMVSDHCRPDQVPAAVGLAMLMKGILVMPVSQMLGWIRDYTQSYTLCVMAQNMMLVLLLIMWIPDMLYTRFCKNRHNYVHDVSITKV